ncbi:Facilitated trehalose transporter Tret1 [Eumeta japonica]|uniref:Facilitated trehalose transporter Tret1 n=1 Tax=Eumeta variegata TaxID=151549 RepID=A0A4C1UFP4_EUMVA|nr:Facilitated trehalose transporter Tret1 [Eumeta japonica]
MICSDAWALTFARAFIGFGSGGAFVVCPLYVKEISEDSIRGMTGTFIIFSQTVGNLLIFILGDFLQFMSVLGVCLAIPILHFLIVLKMPETPSYLIKRGKNQEAAQVLGWLRSLPPDHRTIIEEVDKLVVEQTTCEPKFSPRLLCKCYNYRTQIYNKRGTDIQILIRNIFFSFSSFRSPNHSKNPINFERLAKLIRYSREIYLNITDTQQHSYVATRNSNKELTSHSTSLTFDAPRRHPRRGGERQNKTNICPATAANWRRCRSRCRALTAPAGSNQFDRWRSSSPAQCSRHCRPTVTSASRLLMGVEDADKTAMKAFWVALIVNLTREFCGCIAVLVYASHIFDEAGKLNSSITLSPNKQSMMLATVQIVGSFVACQLVDRAGRKPLLCITSVVAGFSMCLLGIWFYLQQVGIFLPGWVPIMALCVCIFADASGLQPLPFVIMTEMFNFQLRGTVATLIMAISLGTDFALLKLFAPLNSWIGYYSTFWLFSIICLSNVFYLIFCVPETKMRSLEDIYADLENRKKKKNDDSSKPRVQVVDLVQTGGPTTDLLDTVSAGDDGVDGRGRCSHIVRASAITKR